LKVRFDTSQPVTELLVAVAGDYPVMVTMSQDVRRSFQRASVSCLTKSRTRSATSWRSVLPWVTERSNQQDVVVQKSENEVNSYAEFLMFSVTVW